MAAIKHKNSTDWKKYLVKFSKWKNIVVVGLIGVVVIIIVCGIVVLPVDSVELKYEKNVGCVDQIQMQKTFAHKNIWWTFLTGVDSLKKEYPCIKNAWFSFFIGQKLTLHVDIKEVVLEVLRYHVELNDTTSWHDAFRVDRTRAEIYGVSEDASVIWHDSGEKVPRITYLSQGITNKLSNTEIKLLRDLLKLVKSDNSRNVKVEYFAQGVVKVSDAQIGDVYLNLDDQMEVAWRKVLKVNEYLRIRGSKDNLFDARLRDVVVRPL